MQLYHGGTSGVIYYIVYFITIISELGFTSQNFPTYGVTYLLYGMIEMMEMVLMQLYGCWLARSTRHFIVWVMLCLSFVTQPLQDTSDILYQ